MIELINDNICNVNCELMVNAANGIGWFGGEKCAKELRPGVSENMQFRTEGLIQKLARHEITKGNPLRGIIGVAPGGAYITGNCYGKLPCMKVFHAVTMRYPGCRSSKRIVSGCLALLQHYALVKNVTDIAIPYLGCGTGQLDSKWFEDEVKSYFPEEFWEIKLVRYEKTGEKDDK